MMRRVLSMRWVWAVALVAACGESAPAGPDARLVDATVDATSDAPPPPGELEQVNDSGPGVTTATAYPDGTPLATVPWKLVDACRVCQRGSIGMTCGRRESCERNICVLTDGTEVDAGTSIDTPWCHTCACSLDGELTCTPRVDAGCPAGRCQATLFDQAVDLAVDEEVMISECHVARCDAARGLHVMNLCSVSCATPDGDVPADHAGLHGDGCSICLCVAASWCCDGRATCARGGDPVCPGLDD